MVDENKNPTSAEQSVVEKASDFTSALFSQSEALQKIRDFFTEQGKILEENTNLTMKQNQAYSVLATQLFSITEDFKNIGGVNSDGLNTLSRQIKDIIDNASIAGSKIDKMTKIGQVLGLKNIPTDQLEKAIMLYAKSADNAQRLENSFIHLSAESGNLGKVYEAVGTDLSKMNYLLENQAQLLSDVGSATNQPKEKINEYYGQLLKIPGALDSLIKGSEDSTSGTNMLLSTIQVAAGSGRNYSEIINDLTAAYKNYNLTGQDALEFSTRISEASQKLGLRLEDVKSYMHSVSEEFKYFGSQASGSAQMLNEYVEAFQKTGLSGTQAVSMVKDLTSSISKLTLEQKAFLSAQTGGPGGLMGAYQIENMLREDKLPELMDKIRQQLKSQLGTIVTTQEAAASPEAAAQLTRQVELIRQGPMGALVGNDTQKIYRFLEVLATKEKEDTTKSLGRDIVEDTARMGQQMMEKSMTPLSRMSSAITEMTNQAAVSNLTMKEQMLSARTGTQMSYDPNAEVRARMIDQANSAARRTERETIDYNQGLQNQFSSKGTELMGENIRAFIFDMKNITSDVGKSAQKAISNIGVDPTYTPSKQPDLDTIKNQIPISAQQTKESPGFLDSFSLKLPQTTLQTAAERVQPDIRSLPMQTAARAIAEQPAPKTSEQPMALSQLPKPEELEHKVDVQVHGICINCNKEMVEGSAQARKVNPSVTVRR